MLPATTGDWLSVAYMAVFAGALALLGQTWAQAHLPADPHRDHHEHGAGVRGVLRGAGSAASPPTLRMVVGGLVVLGAMLIVELAPRRKLEAEVQHIAV